MQKKKSLWIYIGIAAVYLAAGIILLSFHEPWRDESQAWVLAHNLSWSQIVSVCVSEGHPCLWFYLAKLTILFGLPFKAFGVVSVVFMSVAVFLFLRNSKLSWVSKVIILISPVFFYYNPVICRIYSLVILLICIMCSFWKERHDKPILYGIIAALLFQSHVLIFGLAIGFVIDMIIELFKDKAKRDLKHIVGLLIPVISFVLTILELKQNDQTEAFIVINGEYIRNRLGGRTVFDSIKTISDKFNLPGDGVGIIGYLVLLLIAAILIVGIVMLFLKSRRSKVIREYIVLFCGFAVFLGIVILVRRPDHIQMAIVLWMMLLFFCWITRDDDEYHLKIFEILFAILCIICIPRTVIDTVNDVQNPFSGSKEMARIIRGNVEDNSVIVVRNNEYSTTVVAYLENTDNLIWDIDNGKEYTVHKWGSANRREISEDNLMDYLREDLDYLQKYDNIYYVQTGNELFAPVQIPGLEPVDGNKAVNTWDEYYWLYKVNDEQSER